MVKGSFWRVAAVAAGLAASSMGGAASAAPLTTVVGGERVDAAMLSDFGRITLDPATGAFAEEGMLPVIGFSYQGAAVSPAGFATGAAGSYGAYISYRGTGVQAVGPTGMQATYRTIEYTMYSYAGSAEFGLDAVGSAFVSGAAGATAVATGSLISGSLNITPTAFSDGVPTRFAVSGGILTSVEGLAGMPGIPEGESLGLDISISHLPGEVFPISATTFLAGGGTGSSVRLVGLGAEIPDGAAPTDVPEPASAALLALGMLMAGAAARLRR